MQARKPPLVQDRGEREFLSPRLTVCETTVFLSTKPSFAVNIGFMACESLIRLSSFDPRDAASRQKINASHPGTVDPTIRHTQTVGPWIVSQ